MKRYLRIPRARFLDVLAWEVHVDAIGRAIYSMLWTN